jgi:cell division protein FtsB
MASRRPAGRRARSTRRLIVLGALIAVVLAYLGPVRGYFEQRSELQGYQTALRAAETERDRIARQIAALEQPAVLEARARELDMVLPGERSFLIDGLKPEAPKPEARHEGHSLWNRFLGLF